MCLPLRVDAHRLIAMPHKLRQMQQIRDSQLHAKVSAYTRVEELQRVLERDGQIQKTLLVAHWRPQAVCKTHQSATRLRSTQVVGPSCMHVRVVEGTLSCTAITKLVLLQELPSKMGLGGAVLLPQLQNQFVHELHYAMPQKVLGFCIAQGHGGKKMQ